MSHWRCNCVSSTIASNYSRFVPLTRFFHWLACPIDQKTLPSCWPFVVQLICLSHWQNIFSAIDNYATKRNKATIFHPITPNHPKCPPGGAKCWIFNITSYQIEINLWIFGRSENKHNNSGVLPLQRLYLFWQKLNVFKQISANSIFHSILDDHFDLSLLLVKTLLLEIQHM